MNDEPAPSDTRRSVVAHAVFERDSIGTFERWFEAVLAALAGATASGAIGSWRLAVGLGAGISPDEPVLAGCSERARLAGGELVVAPVASGAARHADSVLLCSGGGAELVLLVDPRAVILATTVARLASAFTGSALAARELPVEREGGRLCVVTSIESFSAGDLAPLSATVRPEAAVVAVPESLTSDDRVTGSGSLVEEVVPVAAARDLLAAQLGVIEPPLVSIVMRTQGSRPEALRDALLTLAGQVDERFELVLVAHDTGRAVVEEVLAEQPPWLRSRTELLEARGGTRSRPLNVGIERARGTLVAFLDDDDVVFGDWVAAFLRGGARYPRRLLRAAAGVQVVTSAEWPGGVQGHAVQAVLETPYPADFDLADHLRVNMTPFMAFAFPRGFFSAFGAADESLEVCEDWDLVLRAATTLGVVDLRVLTAVYRRWNSGGDSYTRHGSAAWERDMRRVRTKLDASPLVLAAGSASELAELSVLRTVRDELEAVRASTSWRISAPVRAASVLWSRVSGGRRRDG